MIPTEELGEEIASLSAHLDAAAHRLLVCIRQFDEAGGWCDQGAVSCAHWLAWRLGWDPATAWEKVRVARAPGNLPAIDEAFRAAGLSYAKVRALTRVATPQNEGKLLEMALVATGARLERLCRGYRAVAACEQTPPQPEERSVHRRLWPAGMVKLARWTASRPGRQRNRLRRPPAFPRKRGGRPRPTARSSSPSRSWPVLL